MAERRQKFWGWGWEDEGPTAEQQQNIAQLVAARLGLPELTIDAPPRLDEITLRRPRLAPPARLAPICSAEPYDRAAHTYGKSFHDGVRAFYRQYPNPPDIVAFPRHEADIIALLDWCTDAVYRSV
jgi:alkyldihydroxyacetonephosphate synthase